MSSNIYELLNDVKTDMGNYKIKETNDMENKRWKKLLQKILWVQGKRKKGGNQLLQSAQPQWSWQWEWEVLRCIMLSRQQ